jgi:hypothetical protein
LRIEMYALTFLSMLAMPFVSSDLYDFRNIRIRVDTPYRRFENEPSWMAINGIDKEVIAYLTDYFFFKNPIGAMPFISSDMTNFSYSEHI